MLKVTGNFRVFWRDVPECDENGNVVSVRRFKITRSTKYNGKVVRQVAWLSEADAKAHGLVDAVKYNLTLSVGKTLTPSKTNGTGYIDEWVFADAKIVSVNDSSGMLCKAEKQKIHIGSEPTMLTHRETSELSKASKERMSFDQWLVALRHWVESNPQIYGREAAHEILTQSEIDLKEFYQDGLSVQAVALGITMNYL